MSVHERQIPLALSSAAPRLTRESYVVCDSNHDVLSLLDNWIASGSPLLAVCGPAASGKTHLAHIIAECAGHAVIIDGARAEAEAPSADIVIVDDAHEISNVKILLSLFEECRAAGVRFVACGQGRPSDWARSLKDLKTRLEAMPRLELAEPDDDLLRTVLRKLFADLQVKVDPTVCAYAAPRLPKTFAAAQQFVAAADALSRERRVPVTKPLAGNVIDNLFCEDSDA